jgi:hypothetical protein
LLPLVGFCRIHIGTVIPELVAAKSDLPQDTRMTPVLHLRSGDVGSDRFGSLYERHNGIRLQGDLIVTENQPFDFVARFVSERVGARRKTFSGRRRQDLYAVPGADFFGCVTAGDVDNDNFDPVGFRCKQRQQAGFQARGAFRYYPDQYGRRSCGRNRLSGCFLDGTTHDSTMLAPHPERIEDLLGSARA